MASVPEHWRDLLRSGRRAVEVLVFRAHTMRAMAVAAGPGLAQWLERVGALAPLVEQYRAEGEQQRRLPKPLAEALRQAGLFSLWVPRSLGGAETDVETSVR